MLNVKEGQIYVCKRGKLPWWTLGKEYKVVKVVFENGLFALAIVDDCGEKWYLPNDDLLKTVFKLNVPIFDLNKLTTSQLREYVELLEDKENTAALLNDFIERMSN